MENKYASFFGKGFKDRFWLRLDSHLISRPVSGDAQEEYNLFSCERARDCLGISVHTDLNCLEDRIASCTAYRCKVVGANISGTLTSPLEAAISYGSYCVLSERNHTVRLALEEGTILVISDIYVRPDYQRKRIATSMVDFLLTSCNPDFALAVLPRTDSESDALALFHNMRFELLDKAELTIPGEADTRTVPVYAAALRGCTLPDYFLLLHSDSH